MNLLRRLWHALPFKPSWEGKVMLKGRSGGSWVAFILSSAFTSLASKSVEGVFFFSFAFSCLLLRSAQRGPEVRGEASITFLYVQSLGCLMQSETERKTIQSAGKDPILPCSCDSTIFGPRDTEQQKKKQQREDSGMKSYCTRLRLIHLGWMELRPVELNRFVEEEIISQGGALWRHCDST